MSFSKTTERAKNDLSGPIPSQASQIRTLSAAQTTFLLTILRVESLRAEGGRPSTMLSYFHKEGINAGPLSPILAVIANSVSGIFKILSQFLTS